MKGRWGGNIKRPEPQLMALVRLPDGRIVKKPVVKKSETSRLYDGFVKSISGIYIPKVMREYHEYVRNGKKLY